MDVYDKSQFPALDKSFTQHPTQAVVAGKEKVIPREDPQPIPPAPPLRLPPELPFVFGSLPTQKPNPRTPVKIKERRLIKDKGGRGMAEDLLSEGDFLPNNGLKECRPEFVWNPRSLDNRQGREERG